MLKVAIIGVTGYSGEELLKLLAFHTKVEVTYVSAKEERQQKVQEIYPYLKGVIDLPCSTLDVTQAEKKSDLVFLALPHTVSMSCVPKLLAAGKRIVDISADYRLKDPSWYPSYYGFSHEDQGNLAEAVYGLPEANREAIKKARLVANPGCYPSGALLGLLPFLKDKKAWVGALTIDAKSGVTGAGRKASKALLFGEVSENFKAYKVLKHQHEAEILQALKNANASEDFCFVPHLLPINRGILTTIYLKPKEALSTEKLQAWFASFYGDEPFVNVLPAGEFPELKNVRGTNQCHIGVGVRDQSGTAVIVTVIDNLQKGASGQAVQNMNLMYGFSETEGLI